MLRLARLFSPRDIRSAGGSSVFGLSYYRFRGRTTVYVCVYRWLFVRFTTRGVPMRWGWRWFFSDAILRGKYRLLTWTRDSLLIHEQLINEWGTLEAISLVYHSIYDSGLLLTISSYRTQVLEKLCVIYRKRVCKLKVSEIARLKDQLVVP